MDVDNLPYPSKKHFITYNITTIYRWESSVICMILMYFDNVIIIIP